MGMQDQGLTPRVQRREDARLRAQVLRVGQKLDEGRAHGLKQQRGHHRHVGQPQRIEGVGQGEDDVVMITGQQSGALHGEPALGLEIRTLRTGAVAARVVPDARDMPVGTGLDMAPEGGGAALHNGTGRAANVEGQEVRLLVSGKRVLEDLLQGDGAHGPRSRAGVLC